MPCPPFSVAGRQLGANDERDLLAWAVDLATRIQPKALMLENVRGLAYSRFAAYRHHMQATLADAGYWSDWRLLRASDYGVPQLRPRFVLVALKLEYADAFAWPEPNRPPDTVGRALRAYMGAAGWSGAHAWSLKADRIAPTIVGGSRKHGGADLGPTRAKRQWLKLSVDGGGIADSSPDQDSPYCLIPRLTNEMVARLQGWNSSAEYAWKFTGRKTSQYRQIGNAFPPPLAAAVGQSIFHALEGKVPKGAQTQLELRYEREPKERAIYHVLTASDVPLTLDDLAEALNVRDDKAIQRALNFLRQDFELEEAETNGTRSYRLSRFKGFTGSRAPLA